MTLLRLSRRKADAHKLDAAEPEKRQAQAFMRALDVRFASPDALLASLPFSTDDATVGTENELQTAVKGVADAVDLPAAIRHSDYYASLAEDAKLSPRHRTLYADLDRYLSENEDRVWESSWVRLPRHSLNAFARAVLDHDLRADKVQRQAGVRGDMHTFLVKHRQCGRLRVPISYLLKLALANVLGDSDNLPLDLRQTGTRLLEHFINDNTSPEQHSAYIVTLSKQGEMGRAVAKENAQRFLLTQLLLSYANIAFRLQEDGQEAVAYFSALPPLRQRRLGAALSDTFYRKLFMNPCLSGWSRGEDKYRYMHLCHEVLGRSRVNAARKLQDLGITGAVPGFADYGIDTSLTNNGTHVSLGSRRLTRSLAADPRGLRQGEKYVGDLVIKITEHFLPLFVGTYTAAPRWMSTDDMTAERALAFLPHQLDPTHLRMTWRSWTHTASTYVPDGRLVDYLVALPSTRRHPALDGSLGSADRLKADLTERGVFDARMPMYLPYRLREFAAMGYSGFEGRYYSVFERFDADLGRAVEVQALVTALAVKYVALGMVGHSAIADAPFEESERRQFFFSSALGLPACYVRRDSRNAFLAYVLRHSEGVRPSVRYPGYVKVPLDAYRRALVRVLLRDGGDLIESMGMSETVNDLAERIRGTGSSVADRLVRQVAAGRRHRADADAMNSAGEHYFREGLRRQQLREAAAFLVEEFEPTLVNIGPEQKAALYNILGEQPVQVFVRSATQALEAGTASVEAITKLIHVLLVSISSSERREALVSQQIESNEARHTPIYRTGNG
jgi:hypothetical protein